MRYLSLIFAELSAGDVMYGSGLIWLGIDTYSTLSQGKCLIQLHEYHMLNELLGVISPHGFDLGNVDLYEYTHISIGHQVLLLP